MKSSTIKNIFMLYGLSIAKLVFPLLTLPYLTRVLSVECYGIVAYVKSVMQYMQLFVDFGFMLSGTKRIVGLAHDKEKIGQATGDILGARLMLSIAAFFGLIVLVFLMPILEGNKLYTLLSFGPVFLSIFLFDYLFRGLEKMQVITIRFVLMRGVATVLTFLLVRNDGDLLWMPVLDILGSLAAVVLVGVQIKRLDVRVGLSSLKSAVCRLKESAVYFISNMATTVFGALNTIIIGMFLPSADVAYWSVSLQLIGAVLALYPPVTDGVYPEMLKTKDLRLAKRVLMICMPVVILGSIFCFAAAEFILVLVGGPQYRAAVSVFRCLVPVLVLCFPAVLCGWPVLGAIDKQKEVAGTTVLTAILQIAGLAVLIVTDYFMLETVALVRCATELVLLSSRVYYCVKFKSEFRILKA